MKHLLIAALLIVLAACQADTPAAQNLVIVSLDTTRADHLALYGYPRPTSPALDGLARHSTVFTNAFAPDTNTNPSHATLFTGKYPHVHGSRANGHVFGADVGTLPEILRQAGFRTAGFVSGFTLVADV